MMLSIVICAALAILVVFSDLSWNNVISSSRNNLVFQNRNQDYGAFAMRREHPRNMVLSILFVVGAATGISAFGLLRESKASFSSIKPPVDCISCDDLWMSPVETKQEKKMMEENEPPADKNEASNKKEPNEGLSSVEVTTEPIKKQVGEIKNGGNPNDDGPIELMGPSTPPSSGGAGSGNGNSSSASTFVTFAQKMPVFPGGEPGLYEYLSDNIAFPEMDRDIASSGTVYVSFIITQTGGVANIKIERGFRGSDRFEKEIIKALSKMPIWTPGENGNQKVNVRLTLPVKFTSL